MMYTGVVSHDRSLLFLTGTSHKKHGSRIEWGPNYPCSDNNTWIIY